MAINAPQPASDNKKMIVKILSVWVHVPTSGRKNQNNPTGKAKKLPTRVNLRQVWYRIFIIAQSRLDVIRPCDHFPCKFILFNNAKKQCGASPSAMCFFMIAF
jgi:hypothetical protein